MNNNDYGVYKGSIEGGDDQWLKTEVPLTFSTYEDCIDNLSYADACSIATYLSNTQGETFSVGRPDDRHP